MDGYDNMVGLRKIFIGLMIITLISFVVQAALPTIDVIYPNGGSTESGNITLIANAQDTDGTISNVEFFHNNNGGLIWIPIGSTNIPSSGNNYSIVWNTTGVPDGNEYSLRAMATDNDSDTQNDSSDNLFTINNNNNQLPTVSLNSPTSGSTVNKTITLNATAIDTDGMISNVTFEFNNGSGWSSIGKFTLNNGDYYYRDWNTELVGNGSYKIQVTATDNSSETNSSTTLDINVNNPPNIDPIVTLNDPPGNNTNGIITLNATATDEIDGFIFLKYHRTLIIIKINTIKSIIFLFITNSFYHLRKWLLKILQILKTCYLITY